MKFVKTSEDDLSEFSRPPDPRICCGSSFPRRITGGGNAAMPRLPGFDRALVVVKPHGGYIASGKKRALVKSRHYRISGQRLLIIERKAALCVITLGVPREISLAGFRRARSRHLVTERERQKWWATKKRFWLYPVLSVRRLRRPVSVDYPQGVQGFVRKVSLRIKR